MSIPSSGQFDIFNRKNKHLLKFMQESKFLVIDPKSSSRVTLRNALSKFGVKVADIRTAETFDSACEEIEKNKPNFVFTEENLEGRSGLQLQKVQMLTVPAPEKAAFVLLSDPEFDFVESRAMESEIDCLFLRPFSMKYIQDEIVRLIHEKYAPNPVHLDIGEGRKHYIAQEYEKSLQKFQDALAQDANNAMAWYYVGACQLELRKFDGAEEAFKECLQCDSKHYKGNMGMIELLYAKREFKRAFAYGMEAFTNFPISPKYFPIMLKAAIACKAYADIFHIYMQVSNLKITDRKMIQSMTAALVVTGKHYLENDVPEKGIDALKKAQMIAKSTPAIEREIVLTVLASPHFEKGREIFERAPAEIKDSPEVQIVDLIRMDKTESPTAVLHAGMKLIQENVTDIRVFEICIKHSVKLGRSDSAIDGLVEEAVGAYPKQREHFEELVRNCRS